MEHMNEDDELDFALRDARDRGDSDRIRKLEEKRAIRTKEKDKLKLDVLKQQVKDMKPTTPTDRTMVTMTRDQEEKAEVQTAQDKATPEQQAKNAARREKSKEESQEYQQDIS
jgi:hypothetical protein